MTLLEEAIIVLWEQRFTASQIAYIVQISIDDVHDIIDWYYGY